MAEIKAQDAKWTRVAYTFMKDNNIGADLRIMLQRFLKYKAALDNKSQACPHQSGFLGYMLLVEVRWPVVGRALIMNTCEQFYLSFAEKVTCKLMQHALHSPSEQVFQQGVNCSTMYFLVAGVAWYLPYSFLVSCVKSDLTKSSPHLFERWQEDFWRRTARRMDGVGTTWCESALFVRWVHTGTLQADPYSAFSLLVLDAQAFEELVTTMPEGQLAMALHATRFYVALSTESKLTDTSSSEDLMNLMFE